MAKRSTSRASRPLRLKVGEHNLWSTSGDYQSVSKSFVVHRGKEEVVRVELQLPPPPPGCDEPTAKVEVKAGGWSRKRE